MFYREDVRACAWRHQEEEDAKQHSGCDEDPPIRHSLACGNRHLHPLCYANTKTHWEQQFCLQNQNLRNCSNAQPVWEQLWVHILEGYAQEYKLMSAGGLRCPWCSFVDPASQRVYKFFCNYSKVLTRRATYHTSVFKHRTELSDASQKRQE